MTAPLLILIAGPYRSGTADDENLMAANLARLEISALLSALVRRVERFELHEATRISNNVLRGYKSLKLTAHTAK